MFKSISTVICTLILLAIYSHAALANPLAPKLSITTINTPNLKVVGSNGERGAAITKLSDIIYRLWPRPIS